MRKYWPLVVIVIVSVIGGAALLAAEEKRHFKELMVNTSGLFFLIVSMLKFWDLKGFVGGFKEYDLITIQWPFYGYLYPFIELLIGVGYLAHFLLVLTGIFTAIVMAILALGIVIALFKGKKLNCACLGAQLNLPLGSVSVVEALGMGVMAVLIVIHSF